MDEITLFNIPITNITLDETISLILKTLAGQKFVQMHFVNAHCVNISRTDTAYLELLQNSDYIFADGVGMKIAASILSSPLADNVNGTDLYPLLLDALEGTGYRIYLLGADPGIAEEMQRRALETHPDLIFCGTHHGFIPPEDNEDVVQQIRQSKADLLLVAMGVPSQEKWINQNLEKTGAKLGMGVGGLFNFYSGNIPRAPMIFRKAGLEWLHRLCMEPRRMWQRYLIGNLKFLWLTIRLRFRP